VPETLGSLIDHVTSQLQGFVTDNPMYGTLVGTAQDDDLSIQIEVPSQSQPLGLIEIGTELIHVTDFDAASGLATIPAWGRGQQGTTAAAHVSGSRVTVNPRYPRSRVALTCNQVIAGMCPPLFGVARGTFETEPQVWEYALPAGTRNLIRVELRPYASSAYDWVPVRGAVIKRDSGSPMLHMPTEYSTHEVRYTVATNPTALTSESDLFTTTGLPESCIDVVTLGAIPRLVSTNELARQQLTSVEATERSTLIPATSGTSAAKFYMQMYEARLEQESMRLRQEYPLTVMRNV
jgi:hypothetical protein